MFRTALSALAIVSMGSIASAPAALAEDVVDVYSARKEALIRPLLDRFKEQTGIDYKLITGKADALLKRLEVEGRLSPADVFITVDAGRLQRAKAAGILRQIDNPKVLAAVPDNLRDRENYWVGLSQRARTIMYARDRVKSSELSTYEGLADPKWKGRVCIRSSSNIYNQSLIASMIEAIGAGEAEAWARGLVANFARPPAGGDTSQLQAAAAGECDVAVANTYYLGRLLNSKKEADRAVGGKLAVFWPNQGDGDRGAHVNVSGAGILKHAPHAKQANRLLEFLVTAQSQAWYAEVNNEYPVVPGSTISDTLKGFGEFRADTMNLSILGERNAEAVKLMDRAGWR